MKPRSTRLFVAVLLLLAAPLEGIVGLRSKGLKHRRAGVLRSISRKQRLDQSPSLFVVVFSFSDLVARRHHLRDTWVRSGLSSPGPITFRFAICANNHASKQALLQENRRFADVLVLGCAEDSQHNPPPAREMTQKLHLAMRAYLTGFRDLPLFMKIEDDTFVPWKRLQRFISSVPKPDYAYMGMMKPPGRPVNRDPSSPWYQPRETYPFETYPVYMERPGYIMGGRLVRRIFETGIAQANLLSNEDQAAGVWVSQLAQQGVPVQYVEFQGKSGYDAADAACNGTWEEYPYLLHHNLRKDYHICLAKMDADENMRRSVKECFTDSIFIAIFSARENVERRALIRKTLQNIDGGSGRSLAKYVICRNKDNMSHAIRQEADQHGDLLMLSCQEGYNRTLLTAKLIKVMQVYLSSFSNRALFMKVDDDTFVAWRRLRKFLAQQDSGDFDYMGIKGPESMPVNRNVTDRWYQPFDTYPNETYPMFMEGGPGYIIGKNLVRQIIETGVAQSNVLSNEDQATGVWVENVKSRGVPVNSVSILGTDGYRPENDLCFGTWKDYPFVLHHHLDGNTIACLAAMDAQDDGDASIEHCFGGCENLTAKFLENRLELMEEEVRDTVSKLRQTEDSAKRVYTRMQWLSSRRNATNGAALTQLASSYKLANPVLLARTADFIEQVATSSDKLSNLSDLVQAEYRSATR